MNRNHMIKNSLVFGVILLFLGVGFQPALATEISINPVSDVEEDCLDCQPVNRVELLKVKLLVIKLKAFNSIILSRFGHIPDIAEKCQEISDRFAQLSVFSNPPICNLLLFILLVIMVPMSGVWAFILGLFEGTLLNYFIRVITAPFRLFSISILVTIVALWEYYDCVLPHP